MTCQKYRQNWRIREWKFISYNVVYWPPGFLSKSNLMSDLSFPLKLDINAVYLTVDDKIKIDISSYFNTYDIRILTPFLLLVKISEPWTSQKTGSMVLNERSMTKPAKWPVRPAKTQISLGIRPIWSASSLSTWRNLGFLASHWAHSEDSDLTGRVSRPIRVFTGPTCHFVGFAMLWHN